MSANISPQSSPGVTENGRWCRHHQQPLQTLYRALVITLQSWRHDEHGPVAGLSLSCVVMVICVRNTCCRTARDSDYCGGKQQRLISEAESARAGPQCARCLYLFCSVMFRLENNLSNVRSIDNKVFSLRILYSRLRASYSQSVPGPH